MKKKITASVVAFALALAVPAAAFAYEPSIEGTTLGDKTMYKFDENNAMEGVEIVGATEGTTVTNNNGSYGMSTSDVVDAVLDEFGEDSDEYSTIQEAAKDYYAQCNKIMDDGAVNIGSFVVNGGVEGETATVTVYLNDYYSGKVVTYVILHEDGSIQKKTVTVNADGTVTIIVSQFSAFSFFMTEGLEGYVPVAQDGVADGALSPKTGF